MTRRVRRLLITGIFCAVCIVFMVLVIVRGPRKVIRFTPPPFDAAAVEGVPALTEEDGYRSINAQVYQFAICGELMLEDGKTDIWLTNDAENNVWLKVVLKDTEGNKLGETGLIRPGEYVQSVRLTTLPDATSDVALVVMGYEPDTYYSTGNVTLYTLLQVLDGEAGAGEEVYSFAVVSKGFEVNQTWLQIGYKKVADAEKWLK